MSGKKNIGSTLILLLTAMIWGSSFVFQKYAVEQLSASFIVAGRFTIAGILLMAITFRKWKTIDRGCLWGGFLAGFTMSLGQILQTVAMGLGTSPGKSAFLTAAYCVMVPFFGWFFMKERPKKNHLLSAVICLAGIGLISLNGGGGLMLGDGITLLCSVVYALNIIAIAMYSTGREPIVFTMVMLVTAAIFGWIGVPFTGGMPETVSMEAAASILYLALFCTALCMSLQTIGLKKVNATVATVILSLESVFGVLFSILLYHETVTVRMGIGFAVVFIAVLISQMEISPEKDTVS
ncbi:MAG: DMT family transporter [Anaerotignum sp.]|nr:DMT family transporter [Anaerotignum sp.]